MMNQDMYTPRPDDASISSSDDDEGNVIDISIEKLRSGSARSARSTVNDDEEDARNASKRSTSSFSSFTSFTTFALSGMWHRKDPEPKSPAKSPGSQKKWKNSKRGRKFSFSSTEEYMEYAARKSFAKEQRAAKKQPEKPAKETTDKKSPTTSPRNWKRYRQGRKFSFTSSEEFLEYVSAKKEEEVFKRAQKRNTQSTEFVKSTEFAKSQEFEALDATADVTVDGAAGDIVDDAAQEIRDVESNSLPDHSESNSRRNSNAESENKKKSCLHHKFTFSDVWRILLLWALIVVIAVVVSKRGLFKADPITTPLGTNTTACSLCPSGFGVHEPELEVLLGDFTCTLEEPLAPTVYTCGEVQKLLNESASCASNEEDEDKDEAGSCSELQEAANQCCFPDPVDILDKEDKIVEEQIKHSGRSVGHLHVGN